MPESLPAWLPTPAVRGLKFLTYLISEIGRHNISHVSAGIAFYGLLALFPGISAALSLTALIIDAEIVARELDKLSEVMPAEAAEIVLDQVHAVAASDGATLSIGFLFGLGLAFYSSSKGMHSLMDGLNMAYNERERRGYLRIYSTRLGLTLVLILGLLVGVSSAVVLPALLAILGVDTLPGGFSAGLRWPVLLALTIFGLRLLYWIGPSHSTPQRGLLTWGTVLAALLWIAASLGFSWYVSNFGNYNETFGALGGVIVLLMWLWISGLVILFGAEIDATIEHFRDQAATPRTLG